MFDELKKSLLSLVGGKSQTMRRYLGEATDDWDESKHPRGNKNNAGQFAKKGERSDSNQYGDGLSKTQIVDCNGNPKTLYHGTGVRFDRFDPGKIGERSSWNGSGFYFSDSETDAKMYGPYVMNVHLDIRKPFDADNYDTLPLPMDRFGLDGRTLPDVEKEVAEIAKTVELAKSDEGNGFVSVFSSTDGGNNWEHLTRGGVNFIGSDESLKDRVARKVFSERHCVDYYSKPLLRDFRPTSITKTLQENGYDGVVAESSNVPGAKEYIAFNPDQIHILK